MLDCWPLGKPAEKIRRKKTATRCRWLALKFGICHYKFHPTRKLIKLIPSDSNEQLVRVSRPCLHGIFCVPLLRSSTFRTCQGRCMKLKHSGKVGPSPRSNKVKRSPCGQAAKFFRTLRHFVVALVPSKRAHGVANFNASGIHKATKLANKSATSQCSQQQYSLQTCMPAWF